MRVTLVIVPVVVGTTIADGYGKAAASSLIVMRSELR